MDPAQWSTLISGSEFVAFVFFAGIMWQKVNTLQADVRELRQIVMEREK